MSSFLEQSNKYIDALSADNYELVQRIINGKGAMGSRDEAFTRAANRHMLLRNFPNQIDDASEN